MGRYDNILAKPDPDDLRLYDSLDPAMPSTQIEAIIEDIIVG